VKTSSLARSARLVRSALAGACFASLVVAGAAIVGCSSGAKREAEAVAQTVERFRRGENPEKPALVENIRAVGCTAQDVCRARDACLASAEATSKALRLKSEVEAGLQGIEKGTVARDSAEALALPQKLDEAEALLKEGFERLPACDDQILALKRTYQF
jgi:hypothetical protein